MFANNRLALLMTMTTTGDDNATTDICKTTSNRLTGHSVIPLADRSVGLFVRFIHQCRVSPACNVCGLCSRALRRPFDVVTSSYEPVSAYPPVRRCDRASVTRSALRHLPYAAACYGFYGRTFAFWIQVWRLSFPSSSSLIVRLNLMIISSGSTRL
jgi:hypothetical protein